MAYYTVYILRLRIDHPSVFQRVKILSLSVESFVRVPANERPAGIRHEYCTSSDMEQLHSGLSFRRLRMLVGSAHVHVAISPALP